MKVCLVGPAYPYRGGIAHFTTVLAREFSKDDDVLVVNFKRLYPSILFPGKTQFDESESPLMVESERIIDSMNPFTFWRAARRIKIYEPDLIIFQWWQPFFAIVYASVLFFLGKVFENRTVFLCHNVLPHESSPVDRMLIRIGLSRVRRFLVQSREDMRNLEKIKKDATAAVHPHPIYEVFRTGTMTRERARDDLGIDGDAVLFFGYIRQYKGVKFLLEAFAGLRRPGLTLHIVGEFYEPKDDYMQAIETLGLEDKVVVVDRYVPNEEVEKYFLACDLVVLPYLSATQSGIVQVAYAFERPVVVTAVGGLPDVVEDGVTGYVVPPGDSGAIAGAIDDFFDKQRAGEMTRNIAAVKDRFSWARCRETLIDLLGNG